MKIELEFEENGIDWENNACLKIEQPSKSLMEIQANREGLISLAKQLLSLAYSTDESFDNFQHWAELGTLENGSLNLSIALIKEIK
jgi:hypothetical protein